MRVCVRERDGKTQIGSSGGLKINESVLKVVILATGLHLTTDCCGDNTRDRASDGETGSDPQADGKKNKTQCSREGVR